MIILIYRCESYDDYDGTKEEWTSKIMKYVNHENCCQLFIEARSSALNIIIAKIENANLICIPDRSFSCFLASFKDLRWNTNRLEEDIGLTDAVTIAKGLYKLCENGII